MIRDNSYTQSEPRLRDTLRDDFSQGGHWNTFRKEFRGLKEFYIDEEKKRRLEAMPSLKRWLYLNGWLLKSMLMRLSPFRRIVLVLGIILLVWSPIVIATNKHTEVVDFHLGGGAIILLVLMLELKDKLLARDELGAGKRVQQALMPEQSPSVPGWSLWIYSRPANEVGGDLIDFLRQSENRFGIALADVSGKGLQAALIMAKLQATLKALAPDYDSIGKLITKLNPIVHRDGLPNSFASLVYAEVSSNSGAIQTTDGSSRNRFKSEMFSSAFALKLCSSEPSVTSAPIAAKFSSFPVSLFSSMAWLLNPPPEIDKFYLRSAGSAARGCRCCHGRRGGQ